MLDNLNANFNMYQYMCQQLSFSLWVIWVHLHYSFVEIIFDEWLNLLSSSSASFSSIVFLPAWWAKTSRSLYTLSKYSSVLQIQNIKQIDYKYLYMSISNTLNFLSLKDYMPSQNSSWMFLTFILWPKYSTLSFH